MNKSNKFIQLSRPRTNFTSRFVHFCIAAIIAVLRIAGQKDPIYQAAAHIYVGGILGYFWATKERYYLWTAVILSLIEIATFLYNSGR